ncbi:MAG TPA: hypothetical protein VGB78_06270 [Thermoplasmata archaeon]
MDFVVSKVALSVCALILMGSVLGVFQGQNLLGQDDDLRDIAANFARLAESLLSQSSQALVAWEVPFSVWEEVIDIELGGDLVSVSSHEGFAVVQLSKAIHTWRWNGSGVNMTELRDLDSEAPELRVSSGTVIELAAILIPVENEQTTMLFARAA